MLSRDEILAKTQMQTKTVSIPEWGGDVEVKEWTATKRADFEMSLDLDGDKSDRTRQMREKAVIASVVDEDGELMFSDIDLPALSSLSASALDRLFDVIAKLNHITKDDEEDLVKNSEQASS